MQQLLILLAFQLLLPPHLYTQTQRFSFYANIHPSISLLLILHRVTLNQVPTSADAGNELGNTLDMVSELGYTLDMVSVHHSARQQSHTLSHTMNNLEIPITLRSMSLGVKSSEAQAKHANSTHRMEPGIKPPTIELWSKFATAKLLQIPCIALFLHWISD